MEKQYFSKEGLEKLKNELTERTTVRRPEIAVRIKEAKEQGDLSENAEFDAAKEAQSINEGRIEEINQILENVIVIEDGKKPTGIIVVGSTIKVDAGKGAKDFTIVGVTESNPTAGFISNESPLGKAFLGHKKGDIVEIRTPRATENYKVLEVK
ncbi:MAG: transcription elongation factor GreA [Candidatus Pacebacteria bacterium]|nr:transcription elongation factor GreA [Candidatus Paceibacterota bacterium]